MLLHSEAASDNDDQYSRTADKNLHVFETELKPTISTHGGRRRFWRMLTQRKTLEDILAEVSHDAESGGDKLGLFDLLAVGIGGTVGSGVFVLTGNVLQFAGPSAALSWVLAGCVCMLSAASYMELSSRLPTKGSCYAFSYHALGELPAVIGGVCLTLEYGLSGAGVARNWSAKLASLIGGQSARKYMYAYYVDDPSDDTDDDFYFDYTAAILQIICVLICISGLTLGKVIINTFTISKVLLVVFMTFAGFAAWNVNVFESTDTFFPNGFGGTLTGTSLLFFGFIGFDEVCCLAAKSKDPAKTMPRAIAGTLIGAAVLSMLAQLSLSTMVKYDDDIGDTSFEEAFKEKGWVVTRWVTAVGEVILLPLVVLVSFLPQPELFAAMSEDGVLPGIFKVERGGVFYWGNVLCGLAMTFFSLCIPFVILWDMISLGVLLGFNLTNSSLILVRFGNFGDHCNEFAQRMVGLLWLFSSIGSYCIWHGLVHPSLAYENITISTTAVGVLALLCAAAVVIHLGLSGQMEKQRLSDDQHARLAVPQADSEQRVVNNDLSSDEPTSSPHSHFRAPFVPYIPSLAITLNFFLTAQFDALSHAYLAALILLMTGIYLSYKAYLIPPQ